MKDLKLYLESLLDDEEELVNDDSVIFTKIISEYICKKYPRINKARLKARYVKGTYFVDYDGFVDVDQEATTLVETQFKWGRVAVFNCEHCKKLTSLEGAPEKCGTFQCNGCDGLKNLIGAPQKCNLFVCSNCNNLISLEGAPQDCKEFKCGRCIKLKTLEGAPQECEIFNCVACDGLKDLTGAPISCEKFYCAKCTSLESLDGMPERIAKAFNYSGCTKLKSTELPHPIKGKIIS